MHILIIGGSVFLGKAMINSALQSGHTLTVFNRGKSNPHFQHQDITIIHGDRNDGFEILDEMHFDAIIDTCGYFPKSINISAQYFANRNIQYCFISTLSVFADISISNDECGQLCATDNPEADSITGENYGALKVLCEQTLLRVIPDALILRPGLIVGPYDVTDRFTWWPLRIGMLDRLQGTMMAPGDAMTTEWEFIDVRDLADFALLLLNNKKKGIYNVNGERIPLLEIIKESEAYFNHTIQVQWVQDADLLSKNAQPWNEIPLWIPESESSLKGFHRTNTTKAKHAGLLIRPLNITIHDTLDWALDRPNTYTLKAGYSEEREREFII